jgi:hypothetical protein
MALRTAAVGTGGLLPCGSSSRGAELITYLYSGLVKDEWSCTSISLCTFVASTETLLHTGKRKSQMRCLKLALRGPVKVKVRVKVKVTLEQAQRGSRGKALLFL